MAAARCASDFVRFDCVTMKLLSGLIFGLLLPMACLAEESVVFYAQLIRATDQDMPQAGGWKAVGPKLSKALCPKFRWKNYWEVSRETIQVKQGLTTRVRLNPDREVEIHLRGDAGEQSSEVRLFHKGVLVRKSLQPLHAPMCIMGGARENEESWFVVIRRDKPTID